jgi:hypothetical protein
VGAEEPGSTLAAGVAEALIASLAAAGEDAGAGTFRLDARQARTKLADYQLAEPAALVLLLVEAAHLLRGCVGVRFELSPRVTRAWFAGVVATADELRGWFDPVFLARAPLDSPDARHLHGRQRLALALNAALGLAGARIRVVSSTDEGALVANLDPDGEVRLAHEPHDHDGERASELRIELQHERLPGTAALLDERARWASLAIHRDGVQINPTAITDALIDAVEIHAVEIQAVEIQAVENQAVENQAVENQAEQGRVLGHVGWSGLRYRVGRGCALLLAHGVVVEVIELDGLPRGCVAALDASDLDRDLSQGRVLRDSRYLARVEAVRRAAAQLSGPAPQLGPNPRRSQLVGHTAKSGALGGLFGSIGLAMTVASLIPGALPVTPDEGANVVGALFGAFFMLFGYGGGGYLVAAGLTSLRRITPARAAASSTPSVATVEAVTQTGLRLDHRVEVELRVRVETPDGAGYPARTRALVDRDQRDGLEPGPRVFVWVHARDRARVGLAHA